MKSQYKDYEMWNPTSIFVNEYTRIPSEKEIDSITEKLLKKSKEEKYGKFSFN